MSHAKHLAWIWLLLFVGCGGDKKPAGPAVPTAQVESAIENGLPATWRLVKTTTTDFKPAAEGEGFQTTYSAMIAPREPMGVPVANLDGTSVVRILFKGDEIVAIYGRAKAVPFGETWRVSATVASDAVPLAEMRKAKPLSALKPHVLIGSPEEDALRSEVTGRREAERRRQRAAAEQRRQAEAEEKRKRAEHAKGLRVQAAKTQAEERQRLAEIAAKEKAAKEARARKTKRDEMLRWLRGLRAERGRILVAGGLREWPLAVLTEVTIREDDLTFSMEGYRTDVFPFTKVSAGGRIVELRGGQPAVSIISDGLPYRVVFDRLMGDGIYRSSQKQGGYIDRMSETERAMWSRAIAASAKSIVAPLNLTGRVLGAEASRRLVATSNYREGRVLTGGSARVRAAIFDTVLDSRSVYLKNGNDLRVRLLGSPMIKSVQLVIYGSRGQTDQDRGARNATVEVNGQKVLVPQIKPPLDEFVVFEVTWGGEAVPLAEVRVAALGHADVSGILFAQ